MVSIRFGVSGSQNSPILRSSSSNKGESIKVESIAAQPISTLSSSVLVPYGVSAKSEPKSEFPSSLAKGGETNLLLYLSLAFS